MRTLFLGSALVILTAAACSSSNSSDGNTGGTKSNGGSAGTPVGSGGTGGSTGGSAGAHTTGGSGATGGSTGGSATGATGGSGAKGGSGATGGSATGATGGSGGKSMGTGGSTGGSGATGGKSATGGAPGTGGAGMMAGAGGSGGASGGSAGASGGSAGAGDTHWVGTWGTGLQITEHSGQQMNWPPIALANATLRQYVHVTIGGSKLRVRVSNEYGTADVAIVGVHIAKPMSGGGIDTTSDKALTFGGMPGTTIATGKSVYTDDFDWTLSPLSDLAITIAFGNQTGEITGHPGSRTTSYMTAGNHLADATISANPTAHWYFIGSVDVMAPASTSAIVILGDSITDGRGSTTDGNDRWPDDLAKRLQADPKYQNIAVLNMGIGGNTVHSGGLGPTAVARFDTQVLQQPGVKWVVVLEGINDIDASTAANLITGDFATFVTKSHGQNLKIYGIPVLPDGGNSSSTSGTEGIRSSVNTWINAAGSDTMHFDKAIPLDKTVGDTSTPPKLQSMYDSGDGLHLNPAGYKAMSDATDLTLFQ